MPRYTDREQMPAALRDRCHSPADKDHCCGSVKTSEKRRGTMGAGASASVGEEILGKDWFEVSD